jgi:ATP-dependent DNA ligase
MGLPCGNRLGPTRTVFGQSAIDDQRREAVGEGPNFWGSVLSRVHWVRPQLVAEVKFLAWTEDNLLRQVVYEGLREDKPASEVRREMP